MFNSFINLFIRMFSFSSAKLFLKSNSQQESFKDSLTLTSFSLDLAFHKTKFEILTPMGSFLSGQATSVTDLALRSGDLSLSQLFVSECNIKWSGFLSKIRLYVVFHAKML